MTIDRRDDERPGDPVVDQAWRSAATDEPSAQLDSTILAAARAATARATPMRAPPATRHWWTHWQPLAAAAGVAGLAFAIVQMLPRDQDVRMGPSLETMQSERAEGVTQDNTAGPAGPATPTAPAEPVTAMERESAPQAAAAAKSAPAAPELPRTPAAPAPAPSAAAARDSAVRSVESDAYAARGLSREAQESSGLPAPEVWARRVEALHAAGDDTAAAESLRAFRTAYPDADRYLPEALQPWAATVERPVVPDGTAD